MHEFRPLPDSDVEMLLRSHWAPTGVELPKKGIPPEVSAAITRLTRGNFRLLSRLLTQMQRVVEINRLSEVLDRCGGDRAREPRHPSGTGLCRLFAHVPNIAIRSRPHNSASDSLQVIK